MMPISCVECRRRKIKCNRLSPCNQCVVKERTCEYPAKFRSIGIDKLVVDSSSLNSPLSSPQDAGIEGSNGENLQKHILKRQKLASSLPVSPPVPIPEHKIEIAGKGPSLDVIVRENEALKLKIKDLKLRAKRDRAKLKNLYYPWEDNTDSEEDYENTHKKHKTRRKRNENQGSFTDISDLNGFNLTEMEGERNSSHENIIDHNDSSQNRKRHDFKRGLPILILPKNKSLKSKQIASFENIEVIRNLIKKFMHLKVHYVNYINIDPLLDFLTDYNKTNEWKSDDDEKLLLIIMILIVSIRSLPNKDEIKSAYNLSYEKHSESLYKQYESLKHDIHTRSTTCLRAYILECEDLFYNNKPEQSWDLLFQCASTAYSLGLHIYDKSLGDTLQNLQHDNASDIVRNDDKSSLWLVINFISATLCAILGRPNPVIFNFQHLLKNYEIRLNYKIGLAELQEKSTNILIDSYKVTIDLNVIMDMDSAFTNEAIIYEKILIDTRMLKSLDPANNDKCKFIMLPVLANTRYRKRSYKDLSGLNLPILIKECPLDIRFSILRPCQYSNDEENYCMIMEDSDTLCDLILIYSNRAKFNQKFMSKYSKALESCIDSCLKVLDHSLSLVELLYKKTSEASFREIYPFFYTFLYQTFVVICTLFNLDYETLSPYYSEIDLLKIKIFKFVDAVGTKSWKPKFVKMIQYVNHMSNMFFNERMERDANSSIPLSYNLVTQNISANWNGNNPNNSINSARSFDNKKEAFMVSNSDKFEVTSGLNNAEKSESIDKAVKMDSVAGSHSSENYDIAYAEKIAQSNHLPLYNVPENLLKQDAVLKSVEDKESDVKNEKFGSVLNIQNVLNYPTQMLGNGSKLGSLQSYSLSNFPDSNVSLSNVLFNESIVGLNGPVLHDAGESRITRASSNLKASLSNDGSRPALYPSGYVGRSSSSIHTEGKMKDKDQNREHSDNSIAGTINMANILDGDIDDPFFIKTPWNFTESGLDVSMSLQNLRGLQVNQNSQNTEKTRDQSI